MSVWETILIYAVIPLAIYCAITGLAMGSKKFRVPRYRPGQPWNYAPVWWSAKPWSAKPAHAEQHTADEHARTARGGARGSW